MTDNTHSNPETDSEDTTTQEKLLPRVFKIGSTRIVEDESMRGMTNEQVQETLAFQYPEVANATIHSTEKDGNLYVEFLKKPGRKG
jgi:PRTRC genetic system protein C